MLGWFPGGANGSLLLVIRRADNKANYYRIVQFNLDVLM